MSSVIPGQSSLSVHSMPPAIEQTVLSSTETKEKHAVVNDTAITIVKTATLPQVDLEIRILKKRVYCLASTVGVLLIGGGTCLIIGLMNKYK